MDDLTPPSLVDPASESERAAQRRRNLFGWACAIGAVLLLVVWIIHHSKATQEQKAQGGPFGDHDAPVAVATGTATTGDMPVTIAALGTVTPLATVTIKTQISGQLTQVAFKEGQMVRQGDFLAQIDPRPYQAALEQAQGNLRRDQALLANAKVDLKRYEGLVAEDSIAHQQLDTQVALVEQYQGTIVGDEAAVDTAKVNLAYTHITSPVTGRAGLRQVDAGNYVTPQDTNGLVVVTQLQPITVIFPVPEDNAPMIMKRLREGTTLTVQSFDRTNTTLLAEGKVLTLDNEIDPTTGTIKLRAEFDNKDNTLFANQFVNVQLLLNVQHDQVIIPTAAVQHGTPNGVATAFVYLVKPDSTVAVQPVTLGTSDGEHTSVLKGLTAGNVVVTEGGDRLREGAKIVPAGASPPKAS
jgi:multidrug efflux system membrane fusion protein